jgi:CTP synthase
VSPDILVCRTEHKLNDGIKRKLALFCNVQQDAIIESLDAETIYDVPNMMLEEKLDEVVLKKMNLPVDGKPDLKVWNTFFTRHKNPKHTFEIGLIGKYV